MAKKDFTTPLSLNGQYPNLDDRYTNNGDPYVSKNAAETALASKLNAYHIGLTVLVKESGWPKAKEYWVQSKGTTPETYGLVEKGAGTTDYADLDNKPTISDGGQGSTQIPLSGNVKVTASTASGDTAGVTVTQGQSAGEIEMQFTLPKGENGQNGANGVTPTIDPTTKHWMIDNVDTQIVAEGKDGADGAPGNNGHNPCLGRLNTLPADLDAAFPNAIAGDYIYVDSVDNTTTTTTVYHYVDSTNGWDSGTAIEFNDATFPTGQSVSTTPIKDLDGNNDHTAEGVLSDAAGKELFEIDKDFDFVPVEDSALSTSNTWQFRTGTSNTFSGDGLNGTFTVVTGGSQPSTQRPFIVLSNIETGHLYRLKCHIVNNGSREFVGFGLGVAQVASPYPQIVDVFGKDTKGIAAHSSGEVNAIFEGDSSKNYLLMSFSGYDTEDTLTISNFVIEEVYSLKFVGDEVKSLKAATFGSLSDAFILADFKVVQVNTGSTAETTSGTRLRIIKEVPAGVHIKAYCGLGKGVACALYDTCEKALLAQQNALENLSYNYTYNVDGQFNNPGWLVVSLCKFDSSAFSAEEKALYLSETHIEVLCGTEKRLEESVGAIMTKSELLSAANVYVKVVSDGDNVNDENGTLLRIVFPVKAGTHMRASTTDPSGVRVRVYSTLYTAIYNTPPTNGVLQKFGEDEYTTDVIEGIINSDGLISISLTNSEIPITDERKTEMLGMLKLEMVDGMAEQIYALENQANLTELFLGKLLQKGLTASGLTDNTKRVSTASCMVVPKERATLYFRLPKDYYVGIRSGDTSSNLTVNEYWYGNSETHTFNSSVHYFRLCFAKVEGPVYVSSISYQDVTVSEIEKLIESKQIDVFVVEWNNDVVNQNMETEKYVKAVMKKFETGAGNNPGLHNLPVFAHISDVHGDASRFEQFADYCDYIGVDAALVSGDTVATNSTDSMQYINDIADTHETPMLLCMGNHDARNLMTAQAQHETILGYLMNKNEVVTNENESYPTYFYKDFAGKQIRVISVNLYELNHTNDTANVTQEQMEWFVSALASTPQGYGVLVMFHSPEKMPQKEASHGAFYQDAVNYTSLQVGITGDPFSQIVDAFIGKTTGTVTYTTNGSTSNTVTVAYDFTSIAADVEFIAFVNGHLHVDRVGVSQSTTNRQLNLNATCGIAVYGSTYPYLANNSDMPRGCEGSTQNCFNIYVIDREAKTVRVAKVGSNVSGFLTERKFMSIPYKIS